MAELISEDSLKNTIESVVDLGVNFLPPSLQEMGSQLATEALFYVLNKTMGIALSTTETSNPIGAALSQISNTLKEINEKLDAIQESVGKLLYEPLYTAKSSLQKATNYLKHGENPEAYEEFVRVMENALKAYSLVEKIEDQVYCKRLEIYARCMKDIYDEDAETFLSLSKIPLKKYNLLADNIKDDLDNVLNQYYKARKAAWRTPTVQEVECIDNLRHLCLPFIWNRFEIFQKPNLHEAIKYLPFYTSKSLIRNTDHSDFYIWKFLYQNPSSFATCYFNEVGVLVQETHENAEEKLIYRGPYDYSHSKCEITGADYSALKFRKEVRGPNTETRISDYRIIGRNIHFVLSVKLPNIFDIFRKEDFSYDYLEKSDKFYWDKRQTQIYQEMGNE